MAAVLVAHLTLDGLEREQRRDVVAERAESLRARGLPVIYGDATRRRKLLDEYSSGAFKLYITHLVLRERSERRELFLRGDYSKRKENGAPFVFAGINENATP